MDRGWSRETFAFAIAVQNLAWGAAGPIAGGLADRFGAFRVIVGCAVLYGLGLWGMAFAPTPLLFALTAGVLIGMAQGGTHQAAEQTERLGVPVGEGADFGRHYLEHPQRPVLVSEWDQQK